MTQKLMREVPAQRFGEQYQALRDEILERLDGVCRRGQFILGPEVEQFERDFARWVGADYGIGCASGSDALYLALRALEIGAGDEVITSPFTYFATAESIVRAGATPVFADIDALTYNIDHETVESRITPRTRAILPVHLYGQACRMDRLVSIAKSRKLWIVEDCAQAHGSLGGGRKVGTFGELGCFSFYPTKNLGTYGDGGLVATSREDLAHEVRLLRGHGAIKKYHHEKLGINSRLDEVQAAILNVKLKYLDRGIEIRREKAHRYNELMKGQGIDQVKIPVEDAHGYHTYHLYVVRASRRDELAEYLGRVGIQCGVYYPTPLHLEKAFAFLGYRLGNFPCAEAASQETLALPLYPELTDADQAYVVEKVAEFYRS